MIELILFVIVAFLLFHMMKGCGCNKVEGVVSHVGMANEPLRPKVFDDRGYPVPDSFRNKHCPNRDKTIACYFDDQNCVLDFDCQDPTSENFNRGLGCIVNPGNTEGDSVRTPCRICGKEGYSKCPKSDFIPGVPTPQESKCDTVPENNKYDCETSYKYCIDNGGNPVYSTADQTYSCNWTGPNNFNRCSEINDCAQPTTKEFPLNALKYRISGAIDCKSSSAQDNDFCELTSMVDGKKRIGICVSNTCFERGNNCKKPSGKLCPSKKSPICVEGNENSKLVCGDF